jgi:hypothetical protein
MKIHLVRSPELETDTFTNVVNVLNQYPGPLEFIAIEDGGIIPSSSQTRTWDNDEDFKRKELHNEVKFSLAEPILFPFNENMRTWEQLFEHCELYRTKHRVSRNDLVVLLTDDNNDKKGTPAVFYRGVRPVKSPAEGLKPDGLLASRIQIASLKKQMELTSAQQSEIEQLEERMEILRAKKQLMDEAAYYEELESIMIEMIRVRAIEP